MADTGLSAPTSSGVPEANQVVASIASVPDDPAAPPDCDTSFSPHQDEYPDADDSDWDNLSDEPDLPPPPVSPLMPLISAGTTASCAASRISEIGYLAEIFSDLLRGRLPADGSLCSVPALGVRGSAPPTPRSSRVRVVCIVVLPCALLCRLRCCGNFRVSVPKHPADMARPHLFDCCFFRRLHNVSCRRPQCPAAHGLGIAC